SVCSHIISDNTKLEPREKLFCCRWVHHRVPLAHREELYHILKMTGPLLLSRILNYLLPFVVTMFCGRLGNEVMADYGLASAFINIITAATGCGRALACDTLVCQVYIGGKNLLRVGVILQRGIIILLLLSAVLLCLGQDPEVARIAQLYMTAFLPAYTWYSTHTRCLCTQGVILPQMYTAAMANIANVMTNYIFLYWLDLAVSGSAAANTLSQIYICTFLFAYIWWKKLHVKTWGGWSVESQQDRGSYMKLAIPSKLVICFEWWVYEFGGFFFPLGIQAAACARVGHALGAGDTAKAILTSKMSLALAGQLYTCSVTGFIFTSDFFNALFVSMGIFLGTGLSLSVTLMFVAKLRVLGLWLGLLISVFLQSIFYIIVIFNLNWKRITEEWPVILYTYNLNGFSFYTVVNGLFYVVFCSVEGYVSVRAERHDGKMEKQRGHVVQQLKGCRLSTTQLILRRGLTMFAAVALLAVGASVHLLVPLPETLPSEANFTLDWINTCH
uniref:Multidrug and toxin extrusion protein n=1 Tax=Sander lucioperca TaxID=283035 RepID=A0A8C9Z020_SANLU